MSDPNNYLGQALHAQGQVRGALAVIKATGEYAARERKAGESWKAYAEDLEKSVVGLIAELKALRGIVATMHQEAKGEKPRRLSDMPLQSLNAVLREEKRLSQAALIADIQQNGDIDYAEPFKKAPTIAGAGIS